VVLVKQAEIVQRKCDVGMIWAKCFFLYQQRPLVQWLSIRVTTLGAIKRSQIIK
jgi:hypothetical protein